MEELIEQGREIIKQREDRILGNSYKVLEKNKCIKSDWGFYYLDSEDLDQDVKNIVKKLKNERIIFCRFKENNIELCIGKYQPFANIGRNKMIDLFYLFLNEEIGDSIVSNYIKKNLKKTNASKKSDIFVPNYFKNSIKYEGINTIITDIKTLRRFKNENTKLLYIRNIAYIKLGDTFIISILTYWNSTYKKIGLYTSSFIYEITKEDFIIDYIMELFDKKDDEKKIGFKFMLRNNLLETFFP